MVVVTPPVIASPSVAGHAVADESAGVNWILLVIGVIAAGGFVAFLTSQPKWLSRKGSPRPVSPPRMFVVLAWQLLVAPFLAAAFASLLLSTEGEGDATLRDATLQLLAAEAVTFPLVLLWIGLGRVQTEQVWVSHAMMRIGSSGGSRPRRGMSSLQVIGFGVLGLVVCWPIVTMTSEVSGLVHQYFTGEPSPIVAHQTLERLASANPSDPWRAVMIFAVVALAPIIEEVIYRGAIQGCLRGFVRSPWLAIVLSAILFGAMHIGTAAGIAIPGLMVFGLGLGIVYERTGTLLAPMIMHGLFNAGNVALLLWMNIKGS